MSRLMSLAMSASVVVLLTLSPAVPAQDWKLGVEVSIRDQSGYGLRIFDVIPGSPAEQLQLQPGDRLYAVQGKRVTDVFTARAWMDPLHEADLTIFRNGKWLRLHARFAMVMQAGGGRELKVQEMTTQEQPRPGPGRNRR